MTTPPLLFFFLSFSFHLSDLTSVSTLY